MRRRHRSVGDTAPVTPTPRRPETLQEAAVRFLRRFGVGAAAWTALLAITERDDVDDPTVLWVLVGVVTTWALVSQFVRSPRRWWQGWFVVALGVELTGPAIGTDGTTLAGGICFLVIAGAALGGKRWYVAVTVAILTVFGPLRPVVDGQGLSSASVATVLLFVFGGAAATLLIEAVDRAQRERDRLSRELAAVERQQAVGRERAEAAARLHDSVLQTLTAIGRADDAEQASRLSARAAQELRDFLRRAADGERAADLGDLLRARVTEAADGARVGVSVVGSHTVDPTTTALVDATAEAVRNAVVHGAPPVRVLLERVDDQLVCWVADRGDGFDPDAVPADRLGVRRSIVARTEAVGGSALLDTTDGCEWRLTVPVGGT